MHRLLPWASVISSHGRQWKETSVYSKVSLTMRYAEGEKNMVQLCEKHIFIRLQSFSMLQYAPSITAPFEMLTGEILLDLNQMYSSCHPNLGICSAVRLNCSSVCACILNNMGNTLVILLHNDSTTWQGKQCTMCCLNPHDLCAGAHNDTKHHQTTLTTLLAV